MGELRKMPSSPGFAYAYGWNAYYQIILGFAAKENEGIFARHRAWLWLFVIFISIWVPQTATFPVLWGDLTAFIVCLSTNMPIAISISKVAVLQNRRKVMGWIISTVVNDWEDVEPKKERPIMLETAKISRLISKLSFTVTSIMFFEYIISRLWKLLDGPDPNFNPRLAFGLLHDCYFPFDTTKINVFIPIWLGQLCATFLSMMCYAGSDCFVSMVVLHLCGQLKVVRNSIKSLIDENPIADPTKYWKRVGIIVKRHEQLNHLAFVIRNTFSSILLVQMLVCSVTFCFQAYTMFTTLMDRNGSSLPIFDLGFFIIYAVYTVIHLFIYCYVGDRIYVESTSLGDEFYDTNWYNLGAKEAKAFFFICHRSRSPLEIKAGKFCTFNLQLFNSILKNSMGYLSMLIAMKDRFID